METDIEREFVAILKKPVVVNEPLGTRVISRKLEEEGIYLTEKGREKLANAPVFDKVGMIASKIDDLSYKTTFDLETKTGDIILNVSLIQKKDFQKAIDIVKEVCKSKLCMSDMFLIAEAGQELGFTIVPDNMVALGTVCAVTINGILLRHKILLKSRFGGILQIDNSKPRRFTEIIEYSSSSIDPAEIFIKGKMTSVLEAARTGAGKVLAGFREIPSVCLNETRNILSKLCQIGFPGTMIIGEPHQPILQIPVSSGYTGLIIPAGLNPLAAVEEAGINTRNMSLSMMMDFQKLKPLI